MDWNSSGITARGIQDVIWTFLGVAGVMALLLLPFLVRGVVAIIRGFVRNFFRV